MITVDSINDCVLVVSAFLQTNDEIEGRQKKPL